MILLTTFVESTQRKKIPLKRKWEDYEVKVLKNHKNEVVKKIEIKFDFFLKFNNYSIFFQPILQLPTSWVAVYILIMHF